MATVGDAAAQRSAGLPKASSRVAGLSPGLLGHRALAADAQPGLGRTGYDYTSDSPESSPGIGSAWRWTTLQPSSSRR